MAAATVARPALSVVIASWNDAHALARCLASLRGQADAAGAEVIVVRNFEAGTADALAQLPGVQDVAMPPGTTVPALRAAGLARARADIVAFLEDHCTCAPGWAASVLRAHALPHAGIGGPVAPQPDATSLDWAVYFYDYGRYMPPCPAGPVDQLSGLNMSFKKAALDDVLNVTSGGVFEAELQGELRRRGRTLYLEPDAVVIHAGRRTSAEALGQAFYLARGYGRRRLAGAPLTRRVLMGAGTVVLPFVLGVRIVARTLQKGRHVASLIRSLPWLALLLIAWSARGSRRLPRESTGLGR